MKNVNEVGQSIEIIIFAGGRLGCGHINFLRITRKLEIRNANSQSRDTSQGFEYDKQKPQIYICLISYIFNIELSMTIS